METIRSIQNILIFEQVARTLSFSASAKALGISKSQVSKSIKALEEELGLSLFYRSTRKIHLSPKGQDFLLQCQTSLRQLEYAKNQIISNSKEPRGSLRVTLAGVFSENFVAPCLIAMAKKYPELKVEANFNSTVVNLIQDQFDVAIRIGVLQDSNLKTQKLGTREEYYVTSPKYLKEFEISRPEDLQQANCLGSEHSWSFQKNNKKWTLEISGNFKCNNPRVIRKAVLEGLGVARLPAAYVQEDIKKGRLVTVLDPFREPAKDIWFITPSKIRYNPNAEYFYQELKKFIRKNPAQIIF